MKSLQNILTYDGSRQFASLPATQNWYAVRDHAHSLGGAKLTGFVSDGITEAWIDFTFRTESFAINDQCGEYWFFVRNAACDEQSLFAVKAHWETLLSSHI